MSLLYFFEGTKIHVKLSGNAPWGIQSLCLTYNAIIERMFFRESAQTIQRLRVRILLSVHPSVASVSAPVGAVFKGELNVSRVYRAG